jgi:hypothetical protein
MNKFRFSMLLPAALTIVSLAVPLSAASTPNPDNGSFGITTPQAPAPSGDFVSPTGPPPDPGDFVSPTGPPPDPGDFVSPTGPPPDPGD